MLAEGVRILIIFFQTGMKEFWICSSTASAISRSVSSIYVNLYIKRVEYRTSQKMHHYNQTCLFIPKIGFKAYVCKK